MIGTQILILDSIIVIENAANIVSKIFLALLIEEVPEFVNSQKRIGIERTIIINIPLESFQLIAAIVLNKVKHTTLVRVKCSRDMLQEQSCIRMNRENALQLLVTDFCLLHNQLAGTLCSITEFVYRFLPFLQNLRILLLCHGRTHQTERHIIRQRDLTDRVNKSALNLAEFLVTVREDMHSIVSDNQHVKRCRTAQIDNPLESGKTAHVIAEVFRKLIPDEHDCLQIILLNDSLNPGSQMISVQLQHLQMTLFCYLCNLRHKLNQAVTGKAFEIGNNSIRICATEYRTVRSGKQTVEEILVQRIVNPLNNRIL